MTDHDVYAMDISFTAEAMQVFLDDGRTLSIPLAWYPRLYHGTPSERLHFELIGSGAGVHWPALDEDISVEGLIAGKRSAESASSLGRWLAKRREGVAHKPAR